MQVVADTLLAYTKFQICYNMIAWNFFPESFKKSLFLIYGMRFWSLPCTYFALQHLNILKMQNPREHFYLIALKSF